MGPAQIRAQLKRFLGWRVSVKAIARVLRKAGFAPVHRKGRPVGDEHPRRFEAPHRTVQDYESSALHHALSPLSARSNLICRTEATGHLHEVGQEADAFIVRVDALVGSTSTQRQTAPNESGAACTMKVRWDPTARNATVP